MELLISLLVAVLFVVLFHKPLHAMPVVFYAVAAAVDLLYAFGAVCGLPLPVWNVVLFLVQRCQLSVMLFAVVMFIGVLAKDSAVRRALTPVRGELSIVAAILAMGHIVYHVTVFARQLASSVGLPLSRTISLLVAVVLVVLLVVLTVTSFKAVRARMSVSAWRMVQRGAYVFFGLVIIHVALIFQPALAAGSQEVWTRFALYAVLFAAYAVLRVRRAVLDGKDHKGKAVAHGE